MKNLKRLFQQAKGNFGHKGRPGKVGGSQKGYGSRSKTAKRGFKSAIGDVQSYALFLDKTPLGKKPSSEWSAEADGTYSLENDKTEASISISQTADTGKDIWDIALFEKGSERVAYGGEQFPLTDKGLNDAKLYAEGFMNRWEWKKPKRQKKAKGAGVSFSIQD